MTEIDQVIGDHPEGDPALHSVLAAISAAVEAMAAFADADTAFAASAPSLPVAEPSLLLLAPALSTLRGVIGDADPFHALGFRRSFVLGRVEAAISGDQTWNPSQLSFMCVDRRDQQRGIARPLLVDLVVDDDLVLCFLQFYQLAKLGSLPALPLQITSADGSNTLTILPSLRVSPSKMRALA